MSNLPTTTLDPSFLRRELHRKRKSFIVRGGSAGAAPGRTTRLLPGQKSAGSPSPDGGYGFPSSRSFPSNIDGYKRTRRLKNRLLGSDGDPRCHSCVRVFSEVGWSDVQFMQQR